jgi:hypothetical protein
MTKKHRVYQPWIAGGQIMTPADLKRLHKELLEFERINHVSDEMRTVIEDPAWAGGFLLNFCRERCSNAPSLKWWRSSCPALAAPMMCFARISRAAGA